MSTPNSPSQPGRAAPAPERIVDPVEAARAVLLQPPPVETVAPVRERIVLAMIMLASIALGGILYLQAGLSLPAAALAGSAALGVSLMVNALAHRSTEIKHLRVEIARLELDLARAKSGALPAVPARSANFGEPVAEAPSKPSASLPPDVRYDPGPQRRSRMVPTPGAQTAPTSQAAAIAVADTASEPQPGQGMQRRPRAAMSASAYDDVGLSVSQGQVSNQRSRRTDSGDIPAWAAPSQAQGDALREDWEASTRQAELPQAIPPHANPQQANSQQAEPPLRAEPSPKMAEKSVMPSAPPRAEVQAKSPMRTIESDLELVQRKIKALADEVNANEFARAPARSEVPSPPRTPEIDDSIAALRTVADRMKPPRKGFATRTIYSEPPPAPARAAPEPASIPPARVTPSFEAQRPTSAGGAPISMAAGNSSAPSATASAGERPSLPSLDMLIPATAQPIAVSTPMPRGDQPQMPSVRTQAPRVDTSLPEMESMARQPASPQQDAVRPKSDRSDVPPELSRRPDLRDDAQTPAVAEETRTPSRRSSAVAPPAGELPSVAPAAEASADVSPPSVAAADRRSAADRRLYDRRFLDIATAIENRRMDVFLNPIVGLGDYAVTHFEVDVRLKSEAGAYIDEPVATLKLHPTDILALFDIERLERSARVGEQLEARGKTGALLSPTAGQSMTDGKFLEAFAQTFEARTTISNQLVLTFSQADVEGFGAGTWQAIADMHSFGFRFAIERITHLGMDFSQLAERGFAFAKLSAEAFLDGLPAGHGMVPPADICRHLSGAGMTLVVESIDDDQLLARVFGFGALFGQGTLFGGARQITLEALGPKRAA